MVIKLHTIIKKSCTNLWQLFCRLNGPVWVEFDQMVCTLHKPFERQFFLLKHGEAIDDELATNWHSKDTWRFYHSQTFTNKKAFRVMGVGLLFQHHNALAKLVLQPLYSTDSGPSDYFLFPRLKKRISEKRFHSNEEVNS